MKAVLTAGGRPNTCHCCYRSPGAPTTAHCTHTAYTLTYTSSHTRANYYPGTSKGTAGLSLLPASTHARTDSHEIAEWRHGRSACGTGTSPEHTGCGGGEWLRQCPSANHHHHHNEYRPPNTPPPPPLPQNYRYTSSGWPTLPQPPTTSNCCFKVHTTTYRP